MEKYTLNAQKRTITGRKVKKLREKGLLPANIYGKNVKSSAVSVDLKTFLSVYSKAKETGIVELKVDQEEMRPVLIHNLQLHPVSDKFVHVDFYQVSLKEKIKAMVPIEIIGQSPAVLNKEGLLLTILTQVEVECLPTDLPEKIKVDVSKLAKVESELKVADLKVDPTKVAILTDVKLVIVKIGSLVTKEVKKEMEAEAAAKVAADAEKAAAAAPSATTPGAVSTPVAPAAGSKPTAKTEEKKPAAQPVKK